MKLIIFFAAFFFSTFVFGQLHEVPRDGDKPTKTFLIETSKPKALVLLIIGGGWGIRFKDGRIYS